MDLVTYHKYRLAVQQNAAPAFGEQLSALADTLEVGLLETELFAQVEVDVTEDPDGLVIAFCEIRRVHDEETVVSALASLWETRLRYPFWDVCTFLVDTSHVEFQATTRPDNQGRYVTVHLVAQKPVVPAPREGADAPRRMGSTLVA